MCDRICQNCFSLSIVTTCWCWFKACNCWSHCLYYKNQVMYNTKNPRLSGGIIYCKIWKKVCIHFSCSKTFVLQWKEHSHCVRKLHEEVPQHHKQHSEDSAGGGSGVWESGNQTEGLDECNQDYEQDLRLPRIWVRFS